LTKFLLVSFDLRSDVEEELDSFGEMGVHLRGQKRTRERKRGQFAELDATRRKGEGRERAYLSEEVRDSSQEFCG